MTIKHNVYFDGAVQSLGFVDDTGTTSMSAGTVLPGEYDFGKAGPKETFLITSGELTISGTTYKKGDTCVIETGNPILISTGVESSYTCHYG